MASHFMHTAQQTNSESSRPLGEPDDRTAMRDRVRSLRIPKSTPRRQSGWLRLAVGFVIVAAAAAVICAHLTRQQGESPSVADKTNAVEKTTTARPQASSSGELVLESKGYVIPAKQVLVSPKVSGMLVKLDILEGQTVEKGSVLAELEDIDYRADYERAKAALEAAEQRRDELKGFRLEEKQQASAELEEAKAQLKQYEADWNRARELAAAQALSTELRDAAESRKTATEFRVKRLEKALMIMELGPREERKKAAEADVRQAAAELDKVRWRLGNCQIRAPISGTILKKNSEAGNIVNPIAFNGSYAICEMADLSKLEVELSIQERDISKVSQGQECRVRAEAFPDRVYAGRVSRLMPIADRAKGAVTVRVEITVPSDEAGKYLKPEMGAVVSFFAPRPAAPAVAEAPAGTSQPAAAPQ